MYAAASVDTLLFDDERCKALELNNIKQAITIFKIIFIFQIIYFLKTSFINQKQILIKEIKFLILIKF